MRQGSHKYGLELLRLLVEVPALNPQLGDTGGDVCEGSGDRSDAPNATSSTHSKMADWYDIGASNRSPLLIFWLASSTIVAGLWLSRLMFDAVL